MCFLWSVFFKKTTKKPYNFGYKAKEIQTTFQMRKGFFMYYLVTVLIVISNKSGA